MAKLASIGQDGAILGFYDPDVHPVIPEGAVPIPDADWVAHISGAERYFDGQSFAVLAMPAPAIADVRAAARRRMVAWIDRLTQQLRADIPRDEVASWPAKAAEARAFLASGTPAPMLEVEASIVGVDVADLADTIAARAAQYETVVGTVAGIRRTTAAAIDAATTSEDVETALSMALAKAITAAHEAGLAVPEEPA